MERGNRKVRSGVVISNKMDKTVVVEVKRVFRHPVYQKVVRVFKRLKAHDAENQCAVGDEVEIIETRPISKDKCFRVVKILGKGKASHYERPKKKEKVEQGDTTTDQA